MKNLSLKEIKERLSLGKMSFETLEELVKEDTRIGLQKILDSEIKKRQFKEHLIHEFERRNMYEGELLKAGFKQIAGLDEVGRGPLAGPVVCACVILDPKKRILGLKDSKKLSAKKREELSKEIKEKALDYSIAIKDASRIDEINILNATKEAMLEAIETMHIKPDYLLIDALELSVNIPQQGIISGDDRSNSIAAASILAKVYRDDLMKEFHKVYPSYNFYSNKGYGTAEHLQALKRIGPSPLHRKSFLRGIL